MNSSGQLGCARSSRRSSWPSGSGCRASSIARWEVDTVEPGLSTLRRVLQACGYDLSLTLVPFERDPERDARVLEVQRLHAAGTAARPARPDRGAMSPARFDPYAILHALEQERVYLRDRSAASRACSRARTSSPTASTSPRRCDRRTSSGSRAHSRSSTPAASTATRSSSRALDPTRTRSSSSASDAGEIKIVLEPAGTRGYDDLRRRATREPIGEGLRPLVADPGDLVRMLEAQAASRPARDRDDAPRRLADEVSTRA